MTLSHIILTITAFTTFHGSAEGATLKIRVLDSTTREPVEMAAVTLRSDVTYAAGGLTDALGVLERGVADGLWGVTVSIVGYKPGQMNVVANGNGPTEYTILLTPNDPLGEVVVTAREGRHATSASVIDTTAMQHLQPSSFTDLLELLPGNVSKDPSMAAPNVINLRTAANVTTVDDYMTSAIGTSFVIDGVPVNTGAIMQTTPDGNHSSRATVGKGVDMRAIATDDIERVEIVRGIAPVEYGELTSGLVNIRRKSKPSRLEARFKADSRSRLFHVGKGFAIPGSQWTINTGAGFLTSTSDKRNPREGYRRVNASLRSDKRFASTLLTAVWNSSVDYTASFERDNNDPDLTVNNTIDRFSTSTHTFSWNNTLSITPVAARALRETTLTAGVSYSRERLHQQRHVASSRIMPMTVSLIPGPNYAEYLPMLYLATLDVEGDPLTAYAKGASTLRFTAGKLVTTLKGGVEWNMSKNYGRGNVYDIRRPITASSGMRPRAFSAVPAMQQLSAYAESRNLILAGPHTMEVTAGVRVTQLLNLDRRYALAGKPYLDPRVTVTWSLPPAHIAGHTLTAEINAGAGMMTKMPVAAFLYPELKYLDFEQLNYYHGEPRYRVMNVLTCVDDLTNYGLRAARNLKRELRLDLGYRGNRLSVTFFRETMNDGFRHTGDVHRYTYRRYDASGFDPYVADRGPTIEELPYTEETYQTVVSGITNGSSTRKEGIEYTLQSRRFPAIHTRLTVNGAYMRTTNCSSQPLWYAPGVNVGGRELQYIGLYDDVDGSVYESLNTNIMADTDLPRLGLRFSVSVQCMWFTSRRTLSRDGIPTCYMAPDGSLHEFTEQSLADPYLVQLVRSYSPSAFDKHTVPAEGALNLKATKSFLHSRINIALYVNRLLTIQPDYRNYGMVVRRYSSPYFGMELNLKI